MSSACSSPDGDQTDGIEAKDTCTGIIETIEGKNATVDIEDGEILKSGRKVRVNLFVADDTTFQVSDKIRSGYDGEVRESRALGINITFVELTD